MSGTILNGMIYLISTVFNIYIFILIIRLVLAWVGTTSQHPVVLFIVSATSPVIKPMRQYIPDFRGFETSTFLLILVLQLIKFLLIFLLAFRFPNIIGLFIVAFADTLHLFIEVFFYSILFLFILSWIQPNNPFYIELVRFNSPILQPFQRIIPNVSNIDMSAIVVCVLLELMNIVVVKKLMSVGMGMAIIEKYL